MEEMEVNEFRKRSIKIQYIELLKNVKSFPDGSAQKRKAKEELHEYLKSVRDRFGQELIDELTNKK